MSQVPHDQLHMHGVDPLHGKHFLVRKRDGRIEEFNEARILLAIESAFKAQYGVGADTSLPGDMHGSAKRCSEKVVDRALAASLRGEDLEVELIQDMVENQLMLEGHLDVVRRYILYREKRRLARVERERRDRQSTGQGPDAALPVFDSLSAPLQAIYRQALPRLRTGEKFEDLYRRKFDGCLNEGEYWGFLTPDLLEYDLDALSRSLQWERDQELKIEQLESLRAYLLKENDRCLETPQYLWMRVAMGLALPEPDPREARAVEFYAALSTFRFIPSDLVLRQAGAPKPCFTVDRTSVQLDAFQTWVEPWHRDILGPLEGKKLRIPDLFMKRVRQNGSWYVFDPAETGELQGLFGADFERRYTFYEQNAVRGAMRFAKRMKAADLWRETLAWVALTDEMSISFKDAGQSPAEPSAVTGAINLAAHISENGRELDADLLRATIASAVRMLDNAVDLNSYQDEASRLNGLGRRPIGLEIVGFREALERLQIPFESPAAADFADWASELISHRALLTSAELARERGPFSAYVESKWSQGFLPGDSTMQLSPERGVLVNVSPDRCQDWAMVRDTIQRVGLRNCTTTAISNVAIPSAIAGVTPFLAFTPGDETDPQAMIEWAARRQKWIDIGQSVPVHTAEKDAGKLSELYFSAWEKGLKSVLHRHRVAAAPVRRVATVPAIPMASAVAA